MDTKHACANDYEDSLERSETPADICESETYSYDYDPHVHTPYHDIVLLDRRGDDHKRTRVCVDLRTGAVVHKSDLHARVCVHAESRAYRVMRRVTRCEMLNHHEFALRIESRDATERVRVRYNARTHKFDTAGYDPTHVIPHVLGAHAAHFRDCRHPLYENATRERAIVS